MNLIARWNEIARLNEEPLNQAALAFLPEDRCPPRNGSNPVKLDSKVK